MPVATSSFFSSPLLPWCDRAGRPSWLRGGVFIALVAPALWLLARWWGEDLGPRPLTEAIHVTGDWAVRFLVAAILVTPLRHLSGSGRIVGVRRMIGLGSLFWAIGHVGLWTVDRSLDFGTIATELLVRPYLTIGFAAFLGLVALGITSRDAAIRRMGAAWKRLHGLVHPITILVLVHVFLQSRLDPTQPAWLTGVAFGGLAVRLAGRGGGSPLSVGAVAVVTAFVTATASEAVWFALKTGRSVLPLLRSITDFEIRVAPSWIAAGIVAAMIGIAVAGLRRRTSPPAETEGRRRRDGIPDRAES